MIKDLTMIQEKSSLIAPGSTGQYIFSGDALQRIDVFLAAQHAAYSRTYFQDLIAKEQVFLNGNKVKKPSISLKPEDVVTVQFPLLDAQKTDKIVDPALKITKVFENEHFLVINKPAALSVHAPSKSTEEASLVDWLLAHFQEIRLVGQEDRPGIVHRLDKDTSGLLLVARNRYAHELLSDMFKQRLIKKTYLAVVKGHPDKTGTIDMPIGRDPIHRIKMSHHVAVGRAAVTHYMVLEYFKDTSLVELKPLTGRTHQLRVHCAALGYPIFGDSLYGNQSKIMRRQALHAQSLEFTFEGKLYSFTQEPPEDFKNLIMQLQ